MPFKWWYLIDIVVPLLVGVFVMWTCWTQSTTKSGWHLLWLIPTLATTFVVVLLFVNYIKPY